MRQLEVYVNDVKAGLLTELNPILRPMLHQTCPLYR